MGFDGSAGSRSAKRIASSAVSVSPSRISLTSFKNTKLGGKVASAWDPPLLDKQDRVERVGESYLKDFRPLALGTMKLDAGRGTLTLRATQVAGKQVMDMRLVTLTLK